MFQVYFWVFNKNLPYEGCTNSGTSFFYWQNFAFYKPLFDIKATLKIDKEKDIIAFIFDIPNPTLETECNFIATVFVEGEPKYFESELYVDDNKFGLCGKNTLFDHVNYGFPLEDIKTVDDMWEAILKILN